LNIFLNITNKCNLSCSHCFIQKLASNNNDIIDINIYQIDEIYKKLKTILKNYPLNIIIYGGEPLLKEKEFFEYLLKHYKNNDIKYTIVTNLLNYTSDWDFIIESLFDSRICTSFDTTRVINNSYNNFVSLWYRKYIQAKNKFNVEINFLITNKFLQHSPLYWFTIIDYLQPSFFYLNHYLTNNPKDPLKTNYNQYIKFIINFSKLFHHYQHSISFYPIKNTLDYFNNYTINGYLPITGNCIDNQLVIQPNGNVGFCQFLTEYGVTFGNIFKDNIEKILTNKNRINFVVRPDAAVDCSDCSYYGKLCYGGCIAEKYLSGLKNISFKAYTNGGCIQYFDFVKEQYAEYIL